MMHVCVLVLSCISLVSETKPCIDRRVVSLQIVEMHVNIDCDGCEGKVRRALEKLEGAYMYMYVVRKCLMITHAKNCSI